MGSSYGRGEVECCRVLPRFVVKGPMYKVVVTWRLVFEVQCSVIVLLHHVSTSEPHFLCSSRLSSNTGSPAQPRGDAMPLILSAVALAGVPSVAVPAATASLGAVAAFVGVLMAMVPGGTVVFLPCVCVHHRLAFRHSSFHMLLYRLTMWHGVLAFPSPSVLF